jgi:nucleoside-diphosphate-sugar epimerase
MSTILVTGASGFLGQYVLTKLLKRNTDRVIAVKHKKEIDIKHNNLSTVRTYDLTKQHEVENLFRMTNPDIVIHLAALVGGIGANRNSPGQFMYANLAMGINLIETARHWQVSKFVCTGTVCSYPLNTPTPFKEDDLWNGYPEATNAPYGIAKKSLLVMLQSYRQQYNLDGIFLLPVNLYGPHDNFDLNTSHVIPALIKKFIKARQDRAPSVTCWGTGKPTREFLYVADCANAIVKATYEYSEPDPLNIGTGNEISIYDLANKIKELCKYQGNIQWDPTYPDGQPRRCLDISRIKQKLGWQPTYDLDVGLRETINWYEENHA